MSLRANLLSLSATLGQKRQRILLPDVPDRFNRRYPERSLNTAKLALDPDGHSTSIRLIYRLPHAAPVEQGDALGVDLGQHALATDSRGGEISYSHMQRVKRRYAHNRKALQEKGTRSARRRLQAMGQRESGSSATSTIVRQNNWRTPRTSVLLRSRT